MNSRNIILGVVIFLNALRFVGTASAPPGFYVDEAVGAAHVICLKETGADFHRESLPLFSAGLGGGYYTAPYLYGEVVWTSVFGNSVAAFRSFNAMVTALTILFMFLWMRRRLGAEAALVLSLLASISPWAFQFSRIAWDPPLAPLFLFMGLCVFDQMNWKWFRVLAGALCFAISAYAYPPSRLQAILFLFLIPGLSWTETFSALGLYAASMIPLILRTLEDSAFSARAKMLAIWSAYPMNPYANESIFGLGWGVVKQVAAHFDPEFLLVSGDHNLRHSTQTVGMLSYVEGALLITGVVWGLISLIRKKPFLNPNEKGIAWCATLGIFTGVLPAALTWESVPHALRSIGAWPFFVILSAVFAERISRAFRSVYHVILVASVLFSSFYLYDYFVNYPANAQAWFQTEAAPIAQAYSHMVAEGARCQSLNR